MKNKLSLAHFRICVAIVLRIHVHYFPFLKKKKKVTFSYNYSLITDVKLMLPLTLSHVFYTELL